MRLKEVVILVVLSLIYCIQAEIPITDFKHTIDCFSDTLSLEQINTLSPLAAKAFASTDLWKNLYQFDDEKYMLVQLLKEIFYLHPQLQVLNPTIHQGKIAYYLTPAVIGHIIQLITFKHEKNTAQQLDIDNLSQALKLSIFNLLNEENKKTFFAHPAHQKVEKASRETYLKQKIEEFLQLIIHSKKEESISYTEGITQQALLSFFCLKFNTRANLAEYFNQLDSNLFKTAFNVRDVGYTLDEYNTIKAQTIKPTNDAISLITNLNKDRTAYEQILWAPLALDVFENTLPTPRRYAEAFYKKGSVNYAFIDCAETAILDFLSIIFKNTQGNNFDINQVKELAKDTRLITFFQNYDNPAILKTTNAHNDWANLVANMPNVIYVSAIDAKGIKTKSESFTTADGFSDIFEINSSLSNIINVLLNLLKLPSLTQFLADQKITLSKNKILNVNQQAIDPKTKIALLEHLLKDLSTNAKQLLNPQSAENTESFSFSIKTISRTFDYSLNINLCLHTQLKTTAKEDAKTYNNYAKSLATFVYKKNEDISPILPLIIAYINYLPGHLIERSDHITYFSLTDPTLITLIAARPINETSSDIFMNLLKKSSSPHSIKFIFNIGYILIQNKEEYEASLGSKIIELFMNLKNENGAYPDYLIPHVHNFEQLLLDKENHNKIPFLDRLATAVIPNLDKDKLDEAFKLATDLFAQTNTRIQALQLFSPLITKHNDPTIINTILSLLADHPTVKQEELPLILEILTAIKKRQRLKPWPQNIISTFQKIILNQLNTTNLSELDITLHIFKMLDNTALKTFWLDKEINEKIMQLTQYAPNNLQLFDLVQFYMRELTKFKNDKQVFSIIKNACNNLLQYLSVVRLSEDLNPAFLYMIATTFNIITDPANIESDDLFYAKLYLQYIFTPNNIFHLSQEITTKISFIANAVEKLNELSGSPNISKRISQLIEGSIRNYLMQSAPLDEYQMTDFFLNIEPELISHSALENLLKLVQQNYAKSTDPAQKEQYKQFLQKFATRIKSDTQLINQSLTQLK